MAVVLPVLPVGLAVLLALHCLDDCDTWWHLAAGRWIAQHRSLPRTDPFSFTAADHQWINVQWLFDLLLYEIFRTGGAKLSVITSAVTYGFAVALLVTNLRLRLGPAVTSALALWTTGIAQERFMIRPEMASFVLLQVLLWLFATAPRDEGRRLWLAPLIMMVWANVHSLFVVGVLTIGCHMTCAVFGRSRLLPANWRRSSIVLTPTARRRVIRCGAVAVLATVVNPYGVAGALFPLKLVSRINGSNPVFQVINEFRSPFSGYLPTFALQAYHAFLTMSVGVVGLAALLTGISRRNDLPVVAIAPAHSASAHAITTEDGDRFDVAGFLLFVMLAYLSVLARRNMALFAMAVTPFVGQCLLIVRSGLPRSLRRASTHAAAVLAIVLPPATALAGWFVVTNGFYRRDLDTRESGVSVQEPNFPIRAAGFIREMKLPPRLYNDLTSGGYLNWDMPVEGGVYIDGRLEVYDVEFFASYIAGVSDPALWQAEADRAGIGTVLLDHRWDARFVLLRYLLNDSRWALVYFDEMAVVFVRRAGNEDRIRQAQAAFPAVNERTVSALLAPTSTWQWPAGRVLALWNYATVSSLMGQADTAAGFFTQLLTLDLPGPWEVRIRLHLADYDLRRGDPTTARRHLLRAADIEPGNPTVAQLLAQSGSK